MTLVVFVCSPPTVATAKGSGEPERHKYHAQIKSFYEVTSLTE